MATRRVYFFSLRIGLLNGVIERQYFLFALEKRTFGVPIADVVKVVSIERIYRIPLLSVFFWGFIIHEKRPVPYINLKKRMNMAGRADNEIGVIVRVGSEPIAFSIDGSYEVVELEREPEPIPMEFKGVMKNFFSARGTHNNRNFIILNVRALAPAS
jgi:chemotaxis signal transduction protein